MRQLALALSQSPEPSLDNFVAGPNSELIERLRKTASGAGGEAIVYLWGEPGSGRTHLLRATVAAARDAVYARADADFAALGATLIAVDDVGQLDDARQIALFNLINRARDSGGTVLAAGTEPPARLALRDDLRSRLGWGLVYRLHAPDDADKARYLREEAGRRGLDLPDEVVDYLLARLPRDLRSLAAIVDLLDRHSLERGRAVTLPLVRDALRDEPGGI
ncbi:MAG: DnaA regulatory inactivator Hda [Betaproteobacteria bacterium]|nr:DnaA regulatory inactivator Hda [Betaproteobacteria bacterium]